MRDIYVSRVFGPARTLVGRWFVRGGKSLSGHDTLLSEDLRCKGPERDYPGITRISKSLTSSKLNKTWGRAHIPNLNHLVESYCSSGMSELHPKGSGLAKK